MARNLYHTSAATVMLSCGLRNLPVWQLKSLGVRLQTATISQLEQRLRQSNRSANVAEASLEFLIGIAGRLAKGDDRTSRAQMDQMKSAIAAQQHMLLVQQQQKWKEAAQKAEEAQQIQSLLASIAALQRAIEKALRAFALETAAALTIVLLALQAELRNLLSQPGIVST